ncbi:MAG TPA: hypothetical protein VGS61_02585 [Acidimicrobiales bacterium]|nr:hypothetical protein [Acidimicrobiales bacterium]
MATHRWTWARLACTGLVASLALVAGPVPLGASAPTPTLRVSPDAGRLGVRVTATVAGFTAYRQVFIYLHDLAPAGACVTGATGACVAVVVVPTGPGGPYPVVARSGAQSASAHFTKTPSLYASPVDAPVGTLLNAWPVGFEPHEHVVVTLDGRTAGTCRTDQWGDCTVPLFRSASAAGHHVLIARGLHSGLRVSETVLAAARA